MSGKQAQQKNKQGGTGMAKEEGSERLKKAKEELPHGDSGGLHNNASIDYAKLGTSNRPLHRQALGAGKGDDLRPAAVDDAVVAQNWCKTFGHKWRDWLDVCANGCGAKKKTK